MWELSCVCVCKKESADAGFVVCNTCCDSWHHAQSSPVSLGLRALVSSCFTCLLWTCLFLFFFETTLFCRVYPPEQNNRTCWRWLVFLINSLFWQFFSNEYSLKPYEAYHNVKSGFKFKKRVDERTGSLIFLIMAGVFGVVAAGVAA